MTDFETAHQFTARWEGGKVDHPNDPGGRTAYGITQAVYRAWRQRQGKQVRDVFEITQDEVLDIYQTNYWPAAAGLPWPLSGVAYDIAVNHGPGNLRYMLGGLPAGGTPSERAARLIDARETFFREIVRRTPTQKVFLQGWLNRVAAQRAWLATQSERKDGPRVFLRDKAGSNVVWDGKPTVYGGVKLSMYPDGALQLERQGENS